LITAVEQNMTELGHAPLDESALEQAEFSERTVGTDRLQAEVTRSLREVGGGLCGGPLRYRATRMDHGRKDLA
jgi:hypothetical protein